MLCGLWTEHANTDDGSWCANPPESAQVSQIAPGLALVSGMDQPGHFLLRYTGTWEECKAHLDRLNEIGWAAWLAEWEQARN